MRISRLDITLRALCLLPALALGGCDPKLKADDLFREENQDSAGSDGDEADTVDADTTDDPEPSPDGESDGSSSSGQPVDEPEDPAFACDVWAQDCAAGEKCAPYDDAGLSWDALKCVPLDPQPQ